jgi:hypothetical protein
MKSEIVVANWKDVMNLVSIAAHWRQVAQLLAVPICLWPMPSAAQEEINLPQSLNVLPSHPSGINLVMKFWENESDANDRFIIEFFSKAKQTDQKGSYYERVMSFANGKRVEFSDFMLPDCSFKQTVIFQARSQGQDKLIVGTAERWDTKSSRNEIVPQSDPLPQRIHLFVLKENTDEKPGKSSLWFDAVKETITERPLCEANEVRAAVKEFLAQNMKSLGLQ